MFYTCLYEFFNLATLIVFLIISVYINLYETAQSIDELYTRANDAGELNVNRISSRTHLRQQRTDSNSNSDANSYATYPEIYFALNKYFINPRNNRRRSTLNGYRSQRSPDAHFIHRPPCKVDSECVAIGTHCDTQLNQCLCPSGYIPKEMNTAVGGQTETDNGGHRHNKSKEMSQFCFKPRQIGEQCASREQCFVTHSLCKKVNYLSFKNESICLCEESHFQEDGIEQVNINGIVLESQVICRYYNRGLSNTQINVLITVIVITLIVFVTCFIAYLKIRSNKRTMNIMTTIAMANADPQDQNTTNGIEVNRDLSNLPPIGSAEAEFQNDFIPVFPMHHLKPCPEKNTTALNMQFINFKNT